MAKKKDIVKAEAIIQPVEQIEGLIITVRGKQVIATTSPQRRGGDYIHKDYLASVIARF